MKKRVISALVAMLLLMGALPAFAEVYLSSDTVANGCAKLPITWSVEGTEGKGTVIYAVYKDGEQVFVSEETENMSFTYTPEEGGEYVLMASIGVGDSEFTLTSGKVPVADKLYMGLFEQNRDETEKEPIEWRVLDAADGKALVISEYVLRPGSYFNPAWIKYKYTYWSGSYIGECGRNNKPGKGETPSYKVTPDTVPLKDGSMGTDADLYYTHARYWLNGEFYQDAFDEKEKERILLTLNENKDNPDSGIAGGPDTEDYVFFISYEEFNKYFTSREEAKGTPTESAKYAHKEMRSNPTCYWWLRTPGEFRCNAMYIHPNGRVSTYGSDVGHDSLGYRPAMWITIGG